MKLPRPEMLALTTSTVRLVSLPSTGTPQCSACGSHERGAFTTPLAPVSIRTKPSTPSEAAEYVSKSSLSERAKAAADGRVTAAYRRSLERHVDRTGVFAGIVVASVLATVGLFTLVPSELAPPEDRGSFFVSVAGPEGAGFDYTVRQMQKVESILLDNAEEGGAIQDRKSVV